VNVVRQELEVTVPIPQSDAEVTVAGWVWAPRDQTLRGENSPIFCCLPGGGCTTGYFDLQIDGLGDYSMAEWLASRGSVVISLDHPGVGRSGRVPDVFALTPGIVADINDRAYRQVMDRLAAGTAIPGHPPLPAVPKIGCGHSMGGMLAAVQQARHHTFDSLVLMGTGNGLPTVLTERERAVIGTGDAVQTALPVLARERFGTDGTRSRAGASPPGTFHSSDVPTAVRQAFAAQLTGLLYSCGLAAMIPLSTAGERAAVDVPSLLIFGDDDLEQQPHECVAPYRSSPDVTLHVVAGCGHCHNQSSRRVEVWQRMLAWAAEIDT
jgi:alpha-beta hydrolase superfamily lysophospholipase